MRYTAAHWGIYEVDDGPRGPRIRSFRQDPDASPIGLHQLARVESSWQRRESIWRRYQEAFSGLPIGLPAPPASGTRHAYHLYTIIVDEAKTGIARDDFLDAMTARGIGTGVHYLALPEHPVYQERFDWRPESWPHALRIGRQTVSLPISPKLTDTDVGRVIAAVHDVLGDVAPVST